MSAELLVGHWRAIAMSTWLGGASTLAKARNGQPELCSSCELALEEAGRLGEPELGEHLVARAGGLPGSAHQSQDLARLPGAFPPKAPGATRQAPQLAHAMLVSARLSLQ